MKVSCFTYKRSYLMLLFRSFGNIFIIENQLYYTYCVFCWDFGTEYDGMIFVVDKTATLLVAGSIPAQDKCVFVWPTASCFWSE